MKPNTSRIFCCCCARDIDARLTDGSEIYPHRADLQALPFWICDICGNYVGCHHKTVKRTKPLGYIPTPEIRAARKRLHAIIDPMWRSGRIGRKALYAAISREIGWDYHTGNTRSMDEVNAVSAAVLAIHSRVVGR